MPVRTRTGGAVAAAWRERMIDNVAAPLPLCAFGNVNFHAQGDVSKIEVGSHIARLNKRTLEWKVGLVIGDASTEPAQSHVKQVYWFGSAEGEFSDENLFDIFWRFDGCLYPQNQVPPGWSVALTPQQEQRVTGLLNEAATELAEAFMFPWSRTGPQINAIQNASWQEWNNARLMSFFGNAVVEKSRHVCRRRVVMLNDLAITPARMFEAIEEGDDEGRRNVVKAFSSRLSLPSINSFDIVVVPFFKNNRFVLVVGDITEQVMYILDPRGVDRTVLTDQDRKSICKSLNDMWVRELTNLHLRRDYFRLTNKRETRQMFTRFELPLLPTGDNADDECGPLVCLYIMAIITGQPFDYGPYAEFKEELRRGVEPDDFNWLDFSHALRRKIMYSIAEYGDNFRFML